MPVAELLDPSLRDIKQSTRPTKMVGAPGVAIWGGYVQTGEKNASLNNPRDRQRTYSEILANTSIVAAGTRYFLNLIGNAKWSFSPAPTDTDGKYSDFAEKALTSDPATPWHRIVRRASMYRFYGFSIQEWAATLDKETDQYTFSDIAPRAQQTIERWATTEEGTVEAVIQRSPQTNNEIYIPRWKTLYLVDDSLSDSPEGLGLFRHLVQPAERLRRYEQLEGFGFETDLRGIPVGRAPFTELAQAVEDGDITPAQRAQIESALRTFIENHIKTPTLGIVLDSITYESNDEANRASGAKQWDIDLLKGTSTSFADNARAIDRLNREMARILGVEQLMLGSDHTGSLALSRDKTNSFFLLVDGSLIEIRESVKRDLLIPLWELNGWPKEMMPEIVTEAIRHTDVDKIATTLRDLATAGAILEPNDPVIGEIRDLLGVSRPSEDMMTSSAEDASLLPSTSQDGGQDVTGGET